MVVAVAMEVVEEATGEVVVVMEEAVETEVVYYFFRFSLTQYPKNVFRWWRWR